MWVGTLSEACKLGSVRLRRTLESPGLSWREDPLLTQNHSSSLCQWSQVRGPFLPLPNPQQTAVGVLGTGRSLSFRHSPLRSQVTARVPGGGGWRRTDTFVVILHLESNGPAQPPGDVQQPLHNELIFLLPRNNRGAEPRVDPWDVSGVL